MALVLNEYLSVFPAQILSLSLHGPLAFAPAARERVRGPRTRKPRKRDFQKVGHFGTF
jgi:hypothetical protein